MGSEMCIRDSYNEFPSSGEVCGEEVGNPPLLPSNNAFKSFYDAVIGPIEDLLGPEDDELVIVSDGALCFIPWAAVCLEPIENPVEYQNLLSIV